MNIHDAAGIAYPFRERDLDSPVTYWTDDDEREYIAWLNRDLAQLSAAFLDAHNDRFDEWCRDKFDAGRALDSDIARGDAELDAEKERL